MNSETIVMCVVALLLGMLLANMLKSVCGCKTVEGQASEPACVPFADGRVVGNGNCVLNEDLEYCNNVPSGRATNEDKCTRGHKVAVDGETLIPRCFWGNRNNLPQSDSMCPSGTQDGYGFTNL